MATMPSEANNDKGFFDRLADRADAMFSHPAFFAFEIVLVLVWACTGWLFDWSDTWHLLINTPTTIITFLLVGLSANTSRRANGAVQQKLNAIAAFLVDAVPDAQGANPAHNELRDAIGLEGREAAQDV
jgi:low affinity Fe/Cu permease